MPSIANSAWPCVAAAILFLGCDGPNPPRQFWRAEDHYTHGLMLANDGQYLEAIDQYDKAIRLDPGQGDWFRHRGIARQQVADYLGSVSDLDEAVKWQKEALATAPDTRKHFFEPRIELYKSGEPYRQS